MLEARDDTLLRYVCLELRFCLEAIIYEKLRLYFRRVPTEVLKRWQPPQLLQALLELEPEADQDFVLRISRETDVGVPSGEWVTIGGHRALKLGWLKKHYNKLGNLLHVLPPEAKIPDIQLNPAALRSYLQEVVVYLQGVVDSTVDTSLAEVVEFRCGVCGDPILCNAATVRKSGRAVCLNPSCRAEFAAWENDDGDFQFQLVASTFRCLACDHGISIENRKLQVGVRFRCPACGNQHEIQGRHWEYRVLDSGVVRWRARLRQLLSRLLRLPVVRRLSGWGRMHREGRPE